MRRLAEAFFPIRVLYSMLFIVHCIIDQLEDTAKSTSFGKFI